MKYVMEIKEKPLLSPLHVGEYFKVLEVTGGAEADMPLHYCTSEAVITIRQGRAILTIDNRDHKLTSGDSFLIPANKQHTLNITEALKAVVVMEKDADIEFVNRVY